MKTDEDAIRAVHADWIAAVDGRDLARLLALMTDDAVFLNPGVAPVGREAFATRFSDGHDRMRIHCVSELQEVAVAGDLAYTLCDDALSVTPRAGGETARLAGQRITLYRRQPDGRWLLARDAHTLSPVAS